MKLHQLTPPPGSRKKAKKIGRGIGSGHGKTATKGHKGQKARSGGRPKPNFEGGQMPLARRLPKRGFNNLFRVEYQVVNVADLKKFESGAAVTPDVLYEKGLIRKKNRVVKILGGGEIDRPLTVTAHGFSRKAVEKIEAAGGSITETDLV